MPSITFALNGGNFTLPGFRGDGYDEEEADDTKTPPTSEATSGWPESEVETYRRVNEHSNRN